MKVFGIKVLKILFWVACGAVSILSMLPGQYVPGVFDWWDKAQHAIAFAALTGLGLFGYNKVNHRVIVGLLPVGAMATGRIGLPMLLGLARLFWLGC